MARRELKGDQDDGGLRLSHSSANVILNCERRYHYKVNDYDFDPDYEDDGQSLRLGKAFHKVLEDTRHDRAKFKPKIFHHAVVDENVKAKEEKGLVLAMLFSYYPLHEKSGLEVAGVELEIGDKHTVGYVDAVMVGSHGDWYLTDNKTAARLSGDLTSRLSNDPQLNLYSFYAPELARALKLDVEKFQGCRYRVTTKTKIVAKNDESVEAYAKRILPRIESYDIGIPYRPEIVKAIRDRHERLHERALVIRDSKESSVMQNFSGCFNYFRPCPYWSRCHGKTFTDGPNHLKIVSAKDMTPTKPERAGDWDTLLDII